MEEKTRILEKLNNVKFCICSKSQKKENIGAYAWYRDYKVALEKSAHAVLFDKEISEFD